MEMSDKVLTALEVLKDAAENDFERHRIDVLIRDLTAPPEVEVIDEKHQIFNGVTYYRNSSGGHYFNNTSLQRAVYNYYYGKIPADYEIHHKDENKNNNVISNLIPLTKAEHRRIHCNNPNVKDMHKARTKKEFICKVCGKKYFAFDEGNNCFCSSKCCDKYQSKQKKFLKVCEYCGKEFFAHRNNHKYCSNKCATLNNWKKRKTSQQN